MSEEANYTEISDELKIPAIDMLKEKLDDRPLIRKAIEDNPTKWYIPYHSYWGMGVRNLLRTEGFGEEYFGIDNLDDIYTQLVEEALLHECSQCGESIEEGTDMAVLGIPQGEEMKDGQCIVCGKPTSTMVYASKTY